MSDKLKSLILAIQTNDGYHNHIIKLLDYTEAELDDLIEEITKCVLTLAENPNAKNRNSMIRTLMNLYTSLHIFKMNKVLISDKDSYEFEIESITGGLFYIHTKEKLGNVKDVTEELLDAFNSHAMCKDDIDNDTSKMNIFTSNTKDDTNNNLTSVIPSIREEFSEEDIECIDNLMANGQLRDFYYFNVMTNRIDYKSYMDARPGVKRRQKIHNLVTAMEGRYRFTIGKDGGIRASHINKKYEFCSLINYLAGSYEYYLNSLERLVGKRYKYNSRIDKVYEVASFDRGGRCLISRAQLLFTKKFYEKLDTMVNWYIDNVPDINTKFDAIIEMFQVSSGRTHRDPYEALMFSLKRDRIHAKFKLDVMQNEYISVIVKSDDVINIIKSICNLTDSQLNRLQRSANENLFKLYDCCYDLRAYNNIRDAIANDFKYYQYNMTDYERFKYLVKHVKYFKKTKNSLEQLGVSQTDIEMQNSYEELNSLIRAKIANKFK